MDLAATTFMSWHMQSHLFKAHEAECRILVSLRYGTGTC